MKKFGLYLLVLSSLLVSASATEQQPIAPPQEATQAPDRSQPIIATKPSPVASGNAASAPVGNTTPLSPNAANSDTLKNTLNIVETIFKILAYILGSLWVYYNYFQGRMHKPRLEIKLTGGKLGEPFDKLVKLVVQAKNVGLSKIELKDEGTGIRIFMFDATKEVDNWVHVGTYPILTPYHHWVEPGETIEDSILITVEPGGYAAIKANLNLNSSKVTWKVAAIL